MKTIILSLLSVFLLTNHTIAFTESSYEEHVSYSSFYFNNSIVFTENQIEFAIFPDGQFDFSFNGYGNGFAIGGSVNNFSFNTGFNYNPYIQYDAFGAVIQIENTPIFYDNFGRVVQIGNVRVRYNRFGQLYSVGGLNVVFSNNVIVNYNGFINPFNRFYVFRPWHRYYAVPPVNYCITNARPYRLYYRPVRHAYYRPYTNNERFSSLNSRRSYANTGRINTNYSDKYRQVARSANEKQVRRDYKAGNYSRIVPNRTVKSNRKLSSSHGNTNLKRSSHKKQNNVTTRNRSSSTIDSQKTNKTNSRVNTSYVLKRSNTAVKKTSSPNRSVSSKSVPNKKTVTENNSARYSINRGYSQNRSGSNKTRKTSKLSKNSRKFKTKDTSKKRSTRGAN